LQQHQKNKNIKIKFLFVKALIFAQKCFPTVLRLSAQQQQLFNHFSQLDTVAEMSDKCKHSGQTLSRWKKRKKPILTGYLKILHEYSKYKYSAVVEHST
jgi:hypothetical protein